MEAIRKHRELRLQIVATGMHLLRKFGYTVNEMVRDGWHIDARIRMQAGDDSPLDQAAGLSRGILGIAKFLESPGTDIVLVLGDRIEAMAGALAGIATGRIVAHVHGGDIAPGDLDESFRHAITKLAHVHLTATQAAKRRIIRMGEHADRVHFVGAPGLDRLMSLITDVKGDRKRSGRALVVQHPSGRKTAHERRVMSAVLKATDRAGLRSTIVYPNSDRGHSGIVEAIVAHQRHKRDGTVSVFRSLDRDTYLLKLLEADVLVGNSSSGIIEAPAARTPSVNVGPRQRGRERNGGSVIDANESTTSIRDAIRMALRKRPIIGKATVYGNGQAGLRIADILAALPWDDRFRHKQCSF
jgi:UDP-N-acetylglucosamine 2-epimerase (non-hydrolysing)/GDP/UDP-N,N'-diacetylbacillosamine 2-epimerase (hydrolysing)